MAPMLLTTAAVITCAHQGTVQIVASQTVLKAQGSPVLVAGDLEGRPISGCLQLDDPTHGLVQCRATTQMTTGGSAQITVGNRVALLDTSQGFTTGSTAGVPSTFSVLSAGQTELAGT